MTGEGYQLHPFDIVLLHTGGDKRLGSPGYFAQPGLGREGVLWLVDQSVKVIGIEAYAGATWVQHQPIRLRAW